MPSDAAMKVWREAHKALYWLPKGAQGEQAAAAVIERAIAEAVEQERAQIVAWLRADAWSEGGIYADAIERGEYKERAGY